MHASLVREIEYASVVSRCHVRGSCRVIQSCRNGKQGGRPDRPAREPCRPMGGNGDDDIGFWAASNFKCVVTYIPRKDVRGMRQTIRCEDGSNFKLHAKTDLAVEGDKVTGLWQDKINDVGGTVDGAITANGFDSSSCRTLFRSADGSCRAGLRPVSDGVAAKIGYVPRAGGDAEEVLTSSPRRMWSQCAVKTVRRRA